MAPVPVAQGRGARGPGPGRTTRARAPPRAAPRGARAPGRLFALSIEERAGGADGAGV